MIRRMQEGDLSAVARLEASCFADPWTMEGLKESLENPDYFFFVADVKDCVADIADCGADVADCVTNVKDCVTDGEDCVKDGGDCVVAYGGMFQSFEEGYVTNIAVAEDWRRKRLGEAILQALLLEGSERGIRDFSLEVRPSNEAALRLYQKYGFVTEGVRKHFYEHPTEDALIMWRRS